jgi:chorismate mutase
VARPEHVALCQQYGIQTVWLGARTTANPFMVEEVCEALRGSNMQVMVKNPVSPDLKLWIGAIERLQQAGIDHIAAVHRGFSVYHWRNDQQAYRNDPLWEVALEFRRQRPDIPILCDPSHIGGDSRLVTSLALAAVQLDCDGLMIEVHPSPADAFTDGGQQLTPDELSTLLSSLPFTSGNGNPDKLEPLRKQIDDIDHEILSLLSLRMNLSRQIAHIKKEQNLTVYQAKRWEEVMKDRLQVASELGLSTDFIEEILEKVHGESIRVQMD